MVLGPRASHAEREKCRGLIEAQPAEFSDPPILSLLFSRGGATSKAGTSICGPVFVMARTSTSFPAD